VALWNSRKAYGGVKSHIGHRIKYSRPAHFIYWTAATRCKVPRHLDPDPLVFSFLCLYIMEDIEFDVLLIDTSLTESVTAAYAIATYAISQSTSRN